MRMADNCDANVYDPVGVYSYRSRKCTRKPGHGKEGLYCKQHAKKYPEEANND